MKIKSIHCPGCTRFYTVEWEEYRINDWWKTIWYRYWKGKVIGFDGEKYQLFSRTRRFLDWERRSIDITR